MTKPYFYDQTTFRKLPKRYRKTPDELPTSLRFAHLNPKVAAYLKNQESQKESASKDEATLDDGGGARPMSILPAINQAFRNILRYDELSDDDDEEGRDTQRLLFEQWKFEALNLLGDLEKILKLFEVTGYDPLLTEDLELQLQCGYRELTVEVKYVWREWQLPANKDGWIVPPKSDIFSKSSTRFDETSRSGAFFSPDIDDALSSKTRGNAIVGEMELPTINEPKKGKKGEGKSKLDKYRLQQGEGSDILSRNRKNISVIGSEAGDASSQMSVQRAVKVHKSNRSSQRLSVPIKMSEIPIPLVEEPSAAHVLPDVVPTIVEEGNNPSALVQLIMSKSRLSKLGIGRPTSPLSILRPDVSKSRVGLDSQQRKSCPRRSTAATVRNSVSNVLAKVPSRAASGPTPYLMSVIQFQLSSPLCEEKGWIIHPAVEEIDDTQVDKKNAVLEWAVKRLQYVLKQIKELNEVSKEKGNDKSVVIRYYGDKGKEISGQPRKSVKSKPPLLKGQKPRMPSNVDEKENAHKRRLMVTIDDGSTVVYYPSGRQAIVMSRGRGKDNFYTTVFSDLGNLMAVFTPTGRASIYHENGQIKFCAMDCGGTIQELDGSVSKRWKWPPGSARIPAAIIIQLNDYITFRCQNQTSMHLFYSCMKENLKFSVGLTQDILEQDENETGQLQMSLVFSSDAAKLLSKSRKYQQAYHNRRVNHSVSSFKFKSKRRSSMFPPIGRRNLLLEKKTAEDTEPEKERVAPPENECEKQLHKLRGKVRLLVDQWMEYYRIATGMTSPRIKQGKAAVRDINSAKSSPGGVQVVPQSPSTAVPVPTVSRRAPSAPAGRLYTDASQGASDVEFEPAPGVTFDDNVQEVEFDDAQSEKAPLSAKFRSPAPSTARSQRRSSAVSNKSTLPNFAMPTRTWSPPRGSCPVALRRELLGESRPACRCSRHVVPYITDIEFEEFVEQAPERQMVVISVVSSLYPTAHGGEDMIEKLYNDKNRNRTRPCLQARGDPFRLLRYDIATAAFESHHSQPMLLSRHNVVPGMFLVYSAGKLIFCDHIFNGYGNARKDFQKQMMQCRRQSSLGYSLPRDFRFSPLKGRQGPRSAWGGQIGGVTSQGHIGMTLESAFVPAEKIQDSHSSDSRSQPCDFNYSNGLPIARMVNLKLTQSAHHVGKMKAEPDDPSEHNIPSRHRGGPSSRSFGRHVESARS